MKECHSASVGNYLEQQQQHMAEECSQLEIVVYVKAKSEIWQHCDFVKVKDEVSKTKMVCRHYQIELKI